MLDAVTLWGTIAMRRSAEAERKTAGVSAKRTDDTAIRFLPLIVIRVPSGPRGGEIARISGSVGWAAAESFAIRINARQLCRVRLAHRVSAWVCTQSPEGWVRRYDLDRAVFCDGCHRGLVIVERGPCCQSSRALVYWNAFQPRGHHHHDNPKYDDAGILSATG